MSQVTEYKIPGSPLTMPALASLLDAMFAAVASANRGGAAPSNPFEGMLWWDTSGDPTEVLKRYTAAAGWVNLASVNITTGDVNFYRSGTALGTMATETAADYSKTAAVVLKSLFDANTILAANSDDTPAALMVAEQRIVGRVTGGNIADLTAAQVLSILLASTVAGDIPYFSDTNTLARLAKGTAGQVLKMNSGATAPEWGSAGFDASAGDASCLIRPEAYGWTASTTATSATKVAELKCFFSGTYRVKFYLRAEYQAYYAYARIYKNGVAYGTLRSVYGMSATAFSQDLSFSAGDLIQIYAYSGAASSRAYVTYIDVCASAVMPAAAPTGTYVAV